MIDLRSDTVSQPCAAMRRAMADAPVGDDVYGDDPTVNALQHHCADLLGKEAALFVPSGTQSNLIGILTHCGRGDEYIVAQQAHTYRLEGGGAAALGGIQPQPLEVDARGQFDIGEIEANVKPDDVHFACTRLLCIENTYKGIALDSQYIKEAQEICQKYDLSYHLDGARFFNAAVEKNLSYRELASYFDSISICLSKGLGAPVGSVLLGSETFIQQAKRWRKMLGGGMRQAGIIAAGGLHALENNLDRLSEDHKRATRVAAVFSKNFGDEAVTCATNMVHTQLDPDRYAKLQAHLLEFGINASRTRWVFHLNHSDADIDTLCHAIESFRES